MCVCTFLLSALPLPQPVVSTGLGRRVKGATAEELSVFEAKVDQVRERVRAHVSRMLV